jgi:hypothetical protein
MKLMENKQTAIQGFIEALTSNGYVIINQTLIDTYLAMEKEQIAKAWDDGDYAYFHSKETGRDFDNGEQYYNETYKK